MSSHNATLSDFMSSRTLQMNPTSKTLFLCLIVFMALDQATSLNFSYSQFNKSVRSEFEFNGESNLALGALQVTTEARGDPITNFYGRVMYKKPLKLWSKKNEEADHSFNTTFILRVAPQTDPGGEGLAFVLAKDPYHIPLNSHGQWLGLVNETTNGSSSNSIVAVEFDTKKSYREDLDNNHVGVDINSIKSLKQVSLKGFVNISSDTDVTAMINYNGTSKELKIFVFYTNDSTRSTKEPVISMPLNLSLYLPEEVYVGFSASTSNFTQLNCVRSWYFTSTNRIPSPLSKVSLFPKWVWIVVSLVGVLLVSLVVGFIYWRFKKAREDQEDSSCIEDELEISNIGPKKYKLKELRTVTGNFNPENELGRGGFGIVYKGVLKGDEVAVKRIMRNDQQGRKNMVAEVNTIGRLHHKNLVKLVGWCYDSNELLLVYEYMPNGSLDELLFSEGRQEGASLSWEKRHNIVCGVAQSLDYLHNECSRRVLHRDIKTSNIMLDSEFNPCLGDFGLARMFTSSEKTHYSTREIAGTRAYMAPEIFHTGKPTVETDVYAFGVLALEVISGRRPGNGSPNGELSNSIVELVWEFYSLDSICGVVDPKLKESYDRDQARCVLLIGLACCHPNPYMRPAIRSALQALMGEAIPPLVPYEKPAFVWPVSAPSLTRELDHSFSGGMLSTLGSFSGR